MCVRTVNGFDELSHQCSHTLIFLECSSMLNVAPVTNAFLNYTWLRKCFFSVFSYILTTLLFYRLFDNASMKTYPLCGRRGDKKAFKKTKICGVIASRWVLWRFFLLSQKKNQESIFHFLFTLWITKK